MQPARFKLHAKEHTSSPVQRPNFRGRSRKVRNLYGFSVYPTHSKNTKIIGAELGVGVRALLNYFNSLTSGREQTTKMWFSLPSPMTGLEPATPGLEVRCAVHCATWAEKRETCRQSAFLAVPGYFRIYTSGRLFLQRPPCWYKARAAQSGEVCLLELHIRGILIASPKCLAFLYLFVYCRVQIWAVSTF